MSRHKIIKKGVKKFRALEVRDWLQENRADRKMCRWCGDYPPERNSDYCSEDCAKSGSVVRIGDNSEY